jgi:hypothetical protein
VNAALLIVTSACLTGADPVPLPAPTVPPGAVYADKAPDKAPDKVPDKVPDKPPEKAPEKIPVTPTPGGPVVTPVPAVGGSCGGCNSGCGSSAGSCCGSFSEGHGLFSRFRGFGSHGCDSCNSCGTTYSGCDSCARTSFWDRFRSHSSCGSSCGSSCDSCGSGGHGLFSGWRLGRHSSCGCESSCGCTSGCGSTNGYGTPGVMTPVPVGKPGEPLKQMPKEGGEPKKLPEGGKEAALPVVPELTPASKTIEVGTKSPFELSRRFEKRVNHAADYSQLTGQLFYVHADGGLWVLRYAPLDTEDRNGGGVILARDRPMDTYREGDLVTVRGEILQDRASRYLGAPLYRTSSIQLVERGEP